MNPNIDYLRVSSIYYFHSNFMPSPTPFTFTSSLFVNLSRLAKICANKRYKTYPNACLSFPVRLSIWDALAAKQTDSSIAIKEADLTVVADNTHFTENIAEVFHNSNINTLVSNSRSKKIVSNSECNPQKEN